MLMKLKKNLNQFYQGYLQASSTNYTLLLSFSTENYLSALLNYLPRSCTYSVYLLSYKRPQLLPALSLISLLGSNGTTLFVKPISVSLISFLLVIRKFL